MASLIRVAVDYCSDVKNIQYDRISVCGGALAKLCVENDEMANALLANPVTICMLLFSSS